MNATAIERLLNNFITLSSEVEGVVIVSSTGRQLTRSIGISAEVTHRLTNSILNLASCVYEQCQCNAVDWITVQYDKKHLIFIRCLLDKFLLIKTNVLPSSCLRKKVQQLLQSLQLVIEHPQLEATDVQLSCCPTRPLRRLTEPKINSEAELPSSFSNNTPHDATLNSKESIYSSGQFTSSISQTLDEFEITYWENTLTEIIGPIGSFVCNRILKQNPNMRLTDFIQILASYIPDPQLALEFKNKAISQEA